ARERHDIQQTDSQSGIGRAFVSLDYIAYRTVHGAANGAGDSSLQILPFRLVGRFGEQSEQSGDWASDLAKRSHAFDTHSTIRIRCGREQCVRRLCRAALPSGPNQLQFYFWL